MKNYPKFSVLMSVYTKEKPEYLKESIESIFNQTVSCNEFIIVEDGPLTKELEQVISEKQREYPSIIKTVKLKKNVGLGKALNEGMQHCSYEYIARMDSDDISMPNRFKKQLEYITKHPSSDVVGGQIIEFDNKTKRDLSKRIVPITNQDFERFIKTRNPINHVTVMFKKSSVEECGGYLDCPSYEDYYLWIRMYSQHKTLHNLNDVLVRVRAGEEMIKRRGKKEYVRQSLNFAKKALSLNIITYLDFIKIMFIRTIVAYMPNKIRNSFYQKKLREK